MPQKIAENIFKYQSPTGLTVLMEPLDHVVSTAAVFACPLGSARDGDDHAGCAGVISEWLFRGSGGSSGRDINARLDFLGCHRDESVRAESMFLSTTQIDRSLSETLSIYIDILTRANFDEATFGPCVELSLQELDGLEDQPARKCAEVLRERFFAKPLGSSPYGTKDGLSSLTVSQCRDHAKRLLVPQESLLAVAGKFNTDELAAEIDSLTGHWEGGPVEPIVSSTQPRDVKYIEKDSAQVQIGLAWNAPLASHADFYPCRIAEMVLSGGMSGRLFTEVREKRGLVYSIAAAYRANTQSAGIFVSAGTAPDRAQQTLDVTVEQLRLLAAGITQEELDRARTQLKASLIMQCERTTSRASALVSDWLRLGRARTLDMIAQEIDAVTLEQVNDYLTRNPAVNFAAVLIGPEQLNTAVLT